MRRNPEPHIRNTIVIFIYLIFLLVLKNSVI